MELFVLAYDYPLLGLFWTMLWFFVWVAWLMLLFRIIGDIFRSRDMGGLAKALWCVFVIMLPLLGTLVYLIARGRAMSQRDLAAAASREAEFRSYVQDVAGNGGSADELAQFADLRDRGVITEDEFAEQKAKILA